MKSDEQIIEELRQASEELLMMSESDYPFEVVRWEEAAEITPQLLRQKSGQAADALVGVETIEDFFRAAVTEHEGQGAEVRRTAEKFRRLMQALATNLRDVRAYKVGDVNLPVYIVGRAPSGRWLGLSTRVVET
jgi:hypothetical protein